MVDQVERLARRRLAVEQTDQRLAGVTDQPERVRPDQDADQQLADHRWLTQSIEQLPGELRAREDDEEVNQDRPERVHVPPTRQETGAVDFDSLHRARRVRGTGQPQAPMGADLFVCHMPGRRTRRLRDDTMRDGRGGALGENVPSTSLDGTYAAAAPAAGEVPPLVAGLFRRLPPSRARDVRLIPL